MTAAADAAAAAADAAGAARKRPAVDAPCDEPAAARRADGDGVTTRKEADDAKKQYTVQLFDNHRVRVSDFRLPPGAIASLTATLPTVRWQVDLGRHALQVGTGPSALADVADKQIFFLEAGTTWNLSNAGDGVYRQMVFEVKGPPKYSEDEVKALLARAPHPPDVGTALLFENRYVRAWDFYLEPDEGFPLHHHVLDYVFVYVKAGRVLGFNPDGSPGLAFDDTREENEVVWTEVPENAHEDPKLTHTGKNGVPNEPMREYLIELK